MSTFLQDWLNRRAMSAPKVDKSIIYKLKNHTCDGTGSTCINTGIKILSQSFIQQHPKFQIEISFVGDPSNPSKAHVIRCNRPDQNYQGFYIRVDEQQNTMYRIKLQVEGWDNYTGNTPAYVYTLNNIVIIFDFTNGIFRVINRTQDGRAEAVRFQMVYSFEDMPFTIGGSLINGVDASGGWKETWSGTISSLVIRDMPDSMEYINFADSVVGQICAQNWGDGIGITPAQAAAVTDQEFWSSIPSSNPDVITFNEMRYFTGLTYIPGYAFYSWGSLSSVILPDGILTIGSAAFGNASLSYIEFPASVTNFQGGNVFKWFITVDVVFRGTTPPTFSDSGVFQNVTANIYVPYSADHSVLSAYQTALQGQQNATLTIIELNPDGTIPNS